MPPPTQSSDPYLGKLINDRFRVERLIARGAMGRVYAAEQTPLGRKVAIKILDPQAHVASDPHFERRFFMEASVASNLRHPNTVAVFDYGRTEDGTYFIAMELVEGESLLSMLHREHRLSPLRVTTIAIQIARSLREAHRLDVVHRDLKPANVLITRHGDDADFVKVLDFGLVRPVGEGKDTQEATQTGVFMGSPKYMAPEQIRGGRCDPRTDIYALGAVMYHLLAGAPPFDGDASVKILMAHMHDPVPPITTPGVPEAMKALVYACLAKDPDFRPPSMDTVIDRLKRLGPLVGRQLLADRSTPPLTMRNRAQTDASRAVHASTAPSRRAQAPLTTGSPGTQRPAQVLRSFAKVLLVAAVTGAAGFLALHTLDEPPREAGPWVRPAAPSPAATESASETAPAGALPARAAVRLQLTSEPSGASVEIEGQAQGTTPLRLELRGEQARPGRELHIRFSKPGYRRLEVLRTVKKPGLVVHGALSPLDAEPRGL